MNFKDLLLPLALALLSTWAIQYFFFPRQPDNRAEIATNRGFIAPTSAQVAEPLDFSVDFYDAQPTRPKHITEVTLPYGSLQFSNDGAIIQFMGYKREISGKPGILETVVPPLEKESGMFLVALDGVGMTPYYYDLVERKDEGKSTVLIYKAQSPAATITKQFTIHHESYQIDVKLTIEPQENKSVRPRIFFEAPLAPQGATHGAVQAVFYSDAGSIEKKPLKDVIQYGKENPSLFGLEDHYFINALIKDPQAFAKRAYFKVEGETAQAILQSSPIQEKATWELSFYTGPKEMTSLSKVDTRLEGVLDYGWFAPLSKLLLYLLNFFYGLLKSYGLAIIALTVLVRLLMVPFTLKGEQSRRKHVEAQKKLQYIEQKYKHDPEMLAREKAEFARKHGIPGLLGCLPLLLQIPVFIGLQRVLAHAIELYKVPFLWVPDLSMPDPYYIFPALVGIGMMFQTSVQGNDPRQRVANIVIAIVIAAVTANLSAGLTLFIAVSTLLGLIQTYFQKAW